MQWTPRVNIVEKMREVVQLGGVFTNISSFLWRCCLSHCHRCELCSIWKMRISTFSGWNSWQWRLRVWHIKIQFKGEKSLLPNLLALNLDRGQAGWTSEATQWARRWRLLLNICSEWLLRERNVVEKKKNLMPCDTWGGGIDYMCNSDTSNETTVASHWFDLSTFWKLPENILHLFLTLSTFDSWEKSDTPCVSGLFGVSRRNGGVGSWHEQWQPPWLGKTNERAVATETQTSSTEAARAVWLTDDLW